MSREEPVFIALGSNIGDSAALIRRAMDRLQAFSIRPVRRSSLWRTTPVDCPCGSPPFVNAVVQLVPPPGLSPLDLLRQLRRMEMDFGRQTKKIPNEPRPLDLDLIAFGNRTLHTNELTLPHPRASERRFVLQPMAEIAPEFRFPNQSGTVGELLEHLPSDPGMELLARETKKKPEGF